MALHSIKKKGQNAFQFAHFPPVDRKNAFNYSASALHFNRNYYNFISWFKEKEKKEKRAGKNSNRFRCCRLISDEIISPFHMQMCITFARAAQGNHEYIYRSIWPTWRFFDAARSSDAGGRRPTWSRPSLAFCIFQKIQIRWPVTWPSFQWFAHCYTCRHSDQVAQWPTEINQWIVILFFLKKKKWAELTWFSFIWILQRWGIYWVIIIRGAGRLTTPAGFLSCRRHHQPTRRGGKRPQTTTRTAISSSSSSCFFPSFPPLPFRLIWVLFEFLGPLKLFRLSAEWERNKLNSFKPLRRLFN